MARITDAKCRLCRREGIKLFLKGAKCDSPKCPISKRETVPGMHTMRRRMSSYGTHLREKQRAKRVYGLLDRQFARFFELAEREKGNTGENFIRLLESRLDNVLCRAGFATSHNHARQVVAHGHVRVNGRKVDIPSYLVKAGDKISPAGKDRSQRIFRAGLEETRGRMPPSWLAIQPDALEIQVVSAPALGEVQVALKDQLIVELASR